MGNCFTCIAGHRNVVTTTQHPDSMQRIQALEHKRTTTGSTEEADDTISNIKPNFTTEFRNLEVVEGRSAHFDAKLAPFTDSRMKVEWFHNDKPMQMGKRLEKVVLIKSVSFVISGLFTAGSRFKMIHDFGFVALDILHTIPEDSGVYVCRATNPLGVAETQGALVCHGKHAQVWAIRLDSSGLTNVDR